MIVECMDNWRNAFQGPVWTAVFETLQNVTPETSDGKHPIQGDDIYMVVQSGNTKPVAADNKVESHREYLDLQLVLAGRERLDYWDTRTLTVKTPYDPQRDALFYERKDPVSATLILDPGAFAIFYPRDAHAPLLTAADGPAPVKKVVVKIRANLIKPLA